MYVGADKHNTNGNKTGSENASQSIVKLEAGNMKGN